MALTPFGCNVHAITDNIWGRTQGTVFLRVRAGRLRLRRVPQAALKRKWNTPGAFADARRHSAQAGTADAAAQGIATPHGSSPTGISLITLSACVSITLTLLERPLAT